jgi:superfamily II DNA or RNA helicase
MTYLREYQTQAQQAFQERIDEGQETRLAAEMATGLGKTVTGSALAALYDSAVILTHTEEITAQWAAKLEFAVRQAKGSHSVGIVKADRREFGADLVVASVQTIGRSEEHIRRIGKRSLIIADECHHAVAPSWMSALRGLGAWDGIPTLGLTATLARTDGQGLGHVWEDMVFSRGITWAQRHGYLLDIVPWRIRVPDLKATDSDSAMDAMLADSIAPEAVVDKWMEVATDLPSTVLFAPLVKSAQAFADAFSDRGIKAEVIHGALPEAAREAMLARYEAGTTTVLCNAMVLTEGWDSPRTMCVIWARPLTKAKFGGAPPLFIQGVGRGLRPWIGPEAPPREDQRCLLLALTGEDGVGVASIADLSDRPLTEVEDGKSLMDAEDEYDLGEELDQEDRAYRGPVHMEAWDLAVQQSSKAWKYTTAGAPFLPTAKRSRGYVFVVGSTVWHYGPKPGHPGKFGARRIGEAPDLSLALSLAEDEAQERGGDIGALLADKGRPWRKQVPSVEAVATALRAGVTQAQVDKILGQRAAGKAGKLSDLTDILLASRVIDPIVARIEERK